MSATSQPRNYFVTAQRATAVYHSLTGNFTSPDERNLILNKLNFIDVYNITPEGLRLVKELPILGRIVHLESFRPKNSKKDYLFLLTHKYHSMVLELKNENGVLKANTLVSGKPLEKVVRPVDTGSQCCIDPTSTYLALHLENGIVTISKLDLNCREIRSTNFRLEEAGIQDMTFLHCSESAILCFIHQDGNSRHIKTYEIDSELHEVKRGIWKQDNVESESHLLIPVDEPYGGVILIGQESITYIAGENDYTAVTDTCLSQSTFVCYCKLDALRYILGDLIGRLYMVALVDNPEKVTSSKAEKFLLNLFHLGWSSVPKCISYIDNYHFYVGSRFGDSQLVKIMTEGTEGSCIEIVDTYSSLAPILDMMVLDLDKQGQDQLVTCSGYHKEGSLRIIRNGIGINELANVDIKDVTNVWRLRFKSSDYDNIIVLTYVNETRLLKLVGEELEACQISHFELNELTLYCGNLTDELLLQVSPSGIRLISTIADGKLVDYWKPQDPNSSLLTRVSTNDNQIVVSSGAVLFYLEVIGDKLVQISSTVLENEVACLDINSLSDGKSEYCAVTIWKSIALSILKLPNLELAAEDKLMGKILARSILLVRFETIRYLFVALGDGSLLYYTLNEFVESEGASSISLGEKKKVILGARPAILCFFKSNGTFNIFACSDRPAVIYSSNNKLVFSNVNLKEVQYMCPLNNEVYSDSLVLISSNVLTIGQIDQIQKLHIRSVPLGETAMRVCYQEDTHTFGVITVRSERVNEKGQLMPVIPDTASQQAQQITYAGMSPRVAGRIGRIDSGEAEVHHFLILDQTTFEVTHAHQFLPNEIAVSVASVHLGAGEERTCYFLVGTSFFLPNEMDPTMGRILVFKLIDGKLVTIHEREVAGSPNFLDEFQGKVLVAINSGLRLFNWTLSKELNSEVCYYNSITAVGMKHKGHFILVGDLMRSVSLLAYNSVGNNIEKVANARDPSWQSTSNFIDDDSFLVGCVGYNFLVFQKNIISVQNPDEKYLEEVGACYLGDYPTVMVKGSLVMDTSCEKTVSIRNKPMIVGCNSGAIYIVVQIPDKYFNFLSDLKRNMTKVMNALGNIDYYDYRNYYTPEISKPLRNFVDGDIIENFLDFNSEMQEKCITGLHMELDGEKRQVTVHETIKIVEEMSRIH